MIDGDDDGTGVHPPPPQGIVIRGLINNHGVGVSVPSGSKAINNRVEATISATTTPIKMIAAALPSTLILTSVDYPAGSGQAIGTQIPTDVTIPEAGTPAMLQTGSRTLFSNSATHTLSAENSLGDVFNLEGSTLLSYTNAITAITGNSADQTVYTFSVPYIPAGKGIRARVYWQCTTCTAVNKTFKWQFGGTGGTGGTVTAYTAFSSNLTTLASAEVLILNNPSVENAQTMFLNPIVLNTVFVVGGLTSNPAQDTTTSQAVTFLFNAPNTQTITPLGFIVEAIQ